MWCLYRLVWSTGKRDMNAASQAEPATKRVVAVSAFMRDRAAAREALVLRNYRNPAAFRRLLETVVVSENSFRGV